MKKPELVAPAGDFEKLKVAFHFGADAVYAGLDNFSLRAKTKNFNEQEIRDAIEYTHKLGKKIYIALNIYFTPPDISGLIETLNFLEKIKPDALIISDMGALYLSKKYSPSVPLHISTQANTTNQYAAEFYKEQGVKRVVLARELSLKDTAEFKKSGTELEAFVHGAMCIAYSGRCLLSSYMTTKGLGARENDEVKTRSANKGDCSHSCRWEYVLKEKTRPAEDYIAEEDADGTYIFSSKDICMIDHIADLVDAGVTSFKIEGRMKSVLYISSIVRAYRAAIDHWFDKTGFYDESLIKNELEVVSHREFCAGFFFDDPKILSNTTDAGVYKRETRLAALVEDVSGNKAGVKVYNTLDENAGYEYTAPDMKTIKVGKIIFYDKNNMQVNKVNHGEKVFIELWDKLGNIIVPSPFDILRMNVKF